MKTSQKNYCHICGLLFSISNSKKECSSCQLPVCRSHCTSSSSKSICDFCYKESLISHYQFSNKDLRDVLKQELTDLSKANQANKQTLQDYDQKIKNLQTTLKNLQEKSSSIKQSYEDKTKKEIERNNIFQENYNNLKKSTEEVALGEQELMEKIGSVDEQTEDIKEKLGKYQEERKGLELELESLRESIEMYIPVESIKSKICKLCLHKVEYIYRSTFEEKLGKQEIVVNKPCCCNLI